MLAQPQFDLIRGRFLNPRRTTMNRIAQGNNGKYHSYSMKTKAAESHAIIAPAEMTISELKMHGI
jgi:hypothetical protein